MSLARGKYGIEYNPRQLDDDDSSGMWLIVVAVTLVALVSLAWTLVGRFRSAEVEAEPDPVPADEVRAPEPSPVREVSVVETAPTPQPKAVVPPPAQEPVADPASSVRRPVKVRNLLMRLEAAEKARDVEMAVTTIEAIRALPGSPAADLDDALARRLGVLNVCRLFERRNAQWVSEVTVKRGDSASRIAAEHGSTLASLVRLNGGKVDRLVIGRKLYVMSHPRFNLVIRRRARTADLSLNGKFFKRYDLKGEVTGKLGAYELPDRKRQLWKDLGVGLSEADRAELEMLLPVRTPVLVSEM